MIEKIYKKKYMVVCDNCGEGQECDSWTDALEFMIDEGWKKKLDNGEWKHYCPECQGCNRYFANEKHISRQPVKIIRENFMIKYHCPICNNDEIKGCDYCSSCGKKLDWSEVSHRWV